MINCQTIKGPKVSQEKFVERAMFGQVFRLYLMARKDKLQMAGAILLSHPPPLDLSRCEPALHFVTYFLQNNKSCVTLAIWWVRKT